MVVEKKSACTSEPLAKNVHIHPNQPDLWRISKVKGKTGEYTITAYSRKAPCLRFLGGSSKCTDKYVQLYAKDDGSGQQRWAITPVNPPKPTPSLQAQAPPSSSYGAVEVPAVNYSIGITGYTKSTFGAPQKTAFCNSIVAVADYPKNLLSCVVVFYL